MRYGRQIHIGVDGGGSGCRAALVDPVTGVRRSAEGGPANVTSDFDGGIATIAGLLSQLIGEARPEAGAETHSIWLGLAGITGAVMAGRTEEALRLRFPGARICASGDHEAMLTGALGLGDGTLIGVGTGSFVVRRAAGQVRHLGGRGLILGDQASGGWLGLRLMQEVMLVLDGLRPASPLADHILSHHGHDPGQIIAFARAAVPADLARLAPEVVAAAEAGDELGRALLCDGVEYLIRALEVIGWRPGERLCLAGGLGDIYARHLPAGVLEWIVPAAGTALDGALLLAARAGEDMP
ncbi:ATPase [Frigidibacter sp. RF13]|uniref:BadF/BadG/BcrA/BcrD ATPase family protein n=1 Tax=Frigidibacter sp. RF13 TaxID=2997340 RepID=UPI00226EE2EB|nr:BadF/BadG/BcrA/BcrD ATPase family protein [Frigidibacter sp. RF13]MCY1125642.1 ATPase [Frigidibacter sp. RF13]